MDRTRCGRAVMRARSVRARAAVHRVAGLLVGSVTLAGCAVATGAPSTEGRAPVPSGPLGVPTGSVSADPSGVPAGDSVRPVALRIPAIGVNSRLERLTLDGRGELRAPRDPDKAGWYVDGPVPGDVGPAVLAGHVDSRTGPAVFYRLSTLRAGARVTVALSDGSAVRFRVESVQAFPRAEFPTEQVYGATPEPVLRLITCGGVYDPGNGYRDNVVVFAVPD